MKYNIARHNLLNELSILLENHKDREQQATEYGLTFEQIDKMLNVDKNDRIKILSELFESKEIIAFTSRKNVKGCFINVITGMSSLSKKKYINRNYLLILKYVGYFGVVILFSIQVYNFFYKDS